MKRIISILTLTIFLPLTFFGQVKTLKTSVYFDNNKFVLSKEAKKTLDVFFDTLQNGNMTKVTIKGNTDNTADSLYNIKLSEQRTETVKNYILTKGIDSKIISTIFFGENKPIITNETDEGKQKNRRVDVTISYKTILPKLDTTSLPEKLVVKKDTCKKDTIIILSQGTQIIINKCEYFELKNCLEFTEANSSESILVNGMSLMDTSGIPISSCGMIKISLKAGCTNKDCFKTPVKVRFPVPKEKECDYCGKNARVYIVNNNGNWNQPKGNKSEIKIVKIKGLEYYQFEINCPNTWQNCDCKTTGTKTKFKTKRGYKILSVTISYKCPVMVIRSTPSGKRKNISKAQLPCPKNMTTVTAIIIDKKGDTLILNSTPLNDLPKRVLFARCGKKDTVEKKLLGFIPVKAHGLYRKYFIKPKQLTPKQTTK